jgi:arsenate reductase
MAEGFFGKHGAHRYEASSAGVDSTALHPLTVRVMEEAGVDMAGKRAKGVEEFVGRVDFHIVITVCREAEEKCPIFPGVPKRLHWPFEDPAAFVGTEAEMLEKFREVRDAVEAKVSAFVSRRKNP